MDGSERFHEQGRPVGLEGFDVLDLWRWSTSDLTMNTTRGVLAEYIVARALGISTGGAREEWAVCDLTRADGLRDEVKSPAYFQSWSQKEFSPIQFTVTKTLGWNADTGTSETEPRCHADVYVLALLAHQDQATVDPLDLEQWRFCAVPARDLDARTRSQHSITVNSLKALAGEPVGFRDLAADDDRVACFARRAS